jgi:glycosyltransferase involved in cell wall biosynthesis
VTIPGTQASCKDRVRRSDRRDATETRDTLRIALVIDHPAQQFARALQLLAHEPGLQLQVYYWSTPESGYDPGFARAVSWDIDLLDGYSCAAPRSGRTVAWRVCWLVRQLGKRRPDIVVCYGWGTSISRATIVYCLLTRTRLLMYGDTTWQHSASGRHRLARSAALNLLLRRCSGAISTGTFNREFYIQHGMDPRRIWPGVCPADTEMFGAVRAERRNPLGVDGAELRIGFAGKLTARKGVDELIRAAALLSPAGIWSITVVGDGPLLPELRALVAELGLGDRVTFRGFANTTEMPKLLAGFDVVVVPSRQDMRVLVTIEAMATGAAVIVSDATAVWGQGDLIEDGVTGLVYRSGEPAMLARQIERLLDDPALLDRLQRDGAERSVGFGPAAFARTIREAAQSCLSEGRGLKSALARRNHQPEVTSQ